MKRIIWMVFLICIIEFLLPAQGKKQLIPGVEPELSEYVVESFDPATWVVKARESSSGKQFSFRLSPAVFKGQTFTLEGSIPAPGKQFAVRGPRNVRLENMVVQQHLPGGRLEDKQLGQAPRMQPPIPVPQKLEWEIQSLNPRDFIVVARNTVSRRTIRFRVDPACFTGMRFLAPADNLVKGVAFAIVIPNKEAFQGCCTMLE